MNCLYRDALRLLKSIQRTVIWSHKGHICGIISFPPRQRNEDQIYFTVLNNNKTEKICKIRVSSTWQEPLREERQRKQLKWCLSTCMAESGNNSQPLGKHLQSFFFHFSEYVKECIYSTIGIESLIILIGCHSQ